MVGRSIPPTLPDISRNELNQESVFGSSESSRMASASACWLRPFFAACTASFLFVDSLRSLINKLGISPSALLSAFHSDIYDITDIIDINGTGIGFCTSYQDNQISGITALACLEFMIEADVPGTVRANAPYISDGIMLQSQSGSRRGRAARCGWFLGDLSRLARLHNFRTPRH